MEAARCRWRLLGVDGAARCRWRAARCTCRHHCVSTIHVHAVKCVCVQLVN